ncbi:MAG TPA: nucleotidyltransferase domain-containing protein [Methanosarcinales archaeon]|nr:nucleotidyltransferase domain-containing protein [Methanosarcinales archaeon]
MLLQNQANMRGDIMNKFKKAIEFSNKIKDNPEILQIILFGSVARGEDHVSSDIDIAIVYKEKKQDTMDQIDSLASSDIQLTHLDINELAEESEIVGALSGEGLLLYGRPIIIQDKDIALKSKILISYNLSKLCQKDKMKVYRAMYGTTSTSKYKGKKYKTITTGIIREHGIEKITKGVLLVSREKATKILGILKRFSADWKEIAVWTY